MNYRELVDSTAQYCFAIMQVERSKGTTDGTKVAHLCVDYVTLISDSYGFDFETFNIDVLNSVDDINEIGYTDIEIQIH